MTFTILQPNLDETYACATTPTTLHHIDCSQIRIKLRQKFQFLSHLRCGKNVFQLKCDTLVEKILDPDPTRVPEDPGSQDPDPIRSGFGRVAATLVF